MLRRVGIILILVAVLLLLFNTGPAFASRNPLPGDMLKEARALLEQKLLDLAGFAGITESADGAITVFLENAGAAAAIPDAFQGFNVHKKVTGRFEALVSRVAQPVAPEMEYLPQVRTGVVRPLAGGVSISAYVRGASYAGTLGMVTYDNKILTAAHVIAMSPTGIMFLRTGTPTIQPGSYDGGTQASRVGALQKYISLSFLTTRSPNRADAAAASIDSSITRSNGVEFSEAGNYSVSGTTTLSVGDTVRQSGRTSGVATGTVTSTTASARVYYTNYIWAYFTDQVIVAQPFIQAGDSGSCVDKGGKLAGLVFAGSNTDAIICKAANFVGRLGVNVGP